MGDLISRQAVLDRTVNRNSIWNAITNSEGNNLEDIINSIPSVENKGEWIDKGSLSCRCNQCGLKNNRESSFCPNCGADMRGE